MNSDQQHEPSSRKEGSEAPKNKGVAQAPSEEVRLLAEIIFEEVMQGKTTHLYPPLQKEHVLERICDSLSLHPAEPRELSVEIVTPLSGRHAACSEPQCVLYSSGHQGRVFVRLPECPVFFEELRVHAQARLEQRPPDGAPDAPREQSAALLPGEERAQRRARLAAECERLLAKADYFAFGANLGIAGIGAKEALEAALDHVLKNLFHKRLFLDKPAEDPVAAIRVLLAAGLAAPSSEGGEEANALALKDMRILITLKSEMGQAVVLDGLIEHFGKRPYGWEAGQTVWLTAQLFLAGELRLLLDEEALDAAQAAKALVAPQLWARIEIVKRFSPGAEELRAGQALALELLGSRGPDSPEEWLVFVRQGVVAWRSRLARFQAFVSTGRYPGGREIEDGLGLLDALLAMDGPGAPLPGLMAKGEELRRLARDCRDLNDFYGNQLETWKTLLEALEEFWPNRSILEQEKEAATALDSLRQIREARAPYALVKDVPALVARVREVNQAMLAKEIAAALAVMDKKIARVRAMLKAGRASKQCSEECLLPLQRIRRNIQEERSIPSIAYMLGAAGEQEEESVKRIERAATSPGETQKPIKTVCPAQLSAKPYLESETDVEAFLEKMRAELLSPIKNNMRVKVK